MAEEEGEEITWALVDGFLLYWHPVRPIEILIMRDFDLCFAGYRA